MIGNRKVIDCITFNDELELLNMRLHELDDIVDYFVIVESTQTFSGKEKPALLQRSLRQNRNHAAKFSKFKDKIINYVVEFPSDVAPRKNGTGKAFTRERLQRNAASDAFPQLGLEDNDLIILSSVDEIPRSQAIVDFVNSEKLIEDNRYSLQMRHFFYNFKMERTNYWYAAKLFDYKYFKSRLSGDSRSMKTRAGHLAQGDDLTEALLDARVLHGTPRRRDKWTVRNAGWHIGWFGDAASIEKKMQSFSHFEDLKGCDQEYIKRKIAAGVFIKRFNEDEEVVLHKTLPDDLPKYKDLILDKQYDATEL